MKPINVHEAKTHLSRLLARVERGERIVIARHGVPVAELRPLSRETPRRRLGEDQGRMWVAADFNAPLPAEVLAEFLK